jgi:hypothetical protein
VLDKWAAGRCVPLRLVQRSQIICKAAQGLLSKDIARALHISRPTVQLWRQRFLALRLPGLEKDAPRPGRIPRISHRQVQAVIHATLHTTPRDATHWSARSMARAQGVVPNSFRSQQPGQNSRVRLGPEPEKAASLSISSLPPDYEASDPIGMMHTNRSEYLRPRCAQLAVNYSNSLVFDHRE